MTNASLSFTPGRTVVRSRRAFAVVIAVLLSGVVATGGWAQKSVDPAKDPAGRSVCRTDPVSTSRINQGSPREADRMSGRRTGRGISVHGPVSPRASGFGDAVLGSAIGTVIGGPLGVLMVRGATDDSAWTNAEGRASGTCCGLQRAGLAVLGVAVAAGGGPYGAAQRLDRGGAAVYAPAVSGQVLLGGLGYVVGTTLGSGSDEVLGGLALGIPLAAIGSAAGAVFGAGGSPFRTGRGVLRLDGGTVRIGPPELRVRANVGVDQRPGVQLTLFSAHIQ